MQISVLTIIHNRVDIFSETIRSVLEQSYPVYEFIIIDDGSTANVKCLVESFNDPRIKYFYYKRVGVISKLRNIAVSKANGDYIAFIDSDDLWHKDKIAKHIEFSKKSDAVISVSDCSLFNTKGLIGNSVGKEMHGRNNTLFEELIDYNMSFAFGTNLFYKKNIPGIDTTFDEYLVLGEHDLMLRLSATQKSVFIPIVLNYIRRHDCNISKESSIIDLVSPLEYNRTIDKLRRDGSLSTKKYMKVKASNYSKIGGYYMKKKMYAKSQIYLYQSLKLNFNLYYLKIFLKIMILRWRS